VGPSPLERLGPEQVDQHGSDEFYCRPCLLDIALLLELLASGGQAPNELAHIAFVQFDRLRRWGRDQLERGVPLLSEIAQHESHANHFEKSRDDERGYEHRRERKSRAGHDSSDHLEGHGSGSHDSGREPEFRVRVHVRHIEELDNLADVTSPASVRPRDSWRRSASEGTTVLAGGDCTNYIVVTLPPDPKLRPADQAADRTPGL
jgi:hypothetical protein